MRPDIGQPNITEVFIWAEHVQQLLQFLTVDENSLCNKIVLFIQTNYLFSKRTTKAFQYLSITDKWLNTPLGNITKILHHLNHFLPFFTNFTGKKSGFFTAKIFYR